jgi:recombination protein RecA
MSNRTDEVRSFLAQAQAARPGGGLALAKVIPMIGATLELRAESGPDGERWSCPQLAGRLVELSGVGAVASLTAAVGLVLDAQERDEPVAWLTLPGSTFYPPDVADSGVDLAALVVVRVPDCEAAARAADRLVRSGGFGLVVLDLGAAAVVPTALQGRLVGLAQRHDAAIVCITEKGSETASLGSMVSLRAEAQRLATPEGFRCRVRVLKDKRRGPGWSHEEEVRGPAGLR